MPSAQNFKNHARIDPLFHFVLMPVFLVNFGMSIYATIHRWPEHRHLYPWWILMSLALLILNLKLRMYALKNQDRIIRLEERLRLATLVPASDVPEVGKLTTSQLIALRFASDHELPALALRAQTQNLDAAAIKRSVAHWRADDQRI